jgi:hypothetical protein
MESKERRSPEKDVYKFNFTQALSSEADLEGAELKYY